MQCPTKRVTFHDFCAHPMFQLGWQSAASGVSSWDVDFDLWTENQQLRYERARQFAFAAPHITSLGKKRSDGRCAQHVVEAYARLRLSGVIL